MRSSSNTNSRWNKICHFSDRRQIIFTEWIDKWKKVFLSCSLYSKTIVEMNCKLHINDINIISLQRVCRRLFSLLTYFISFLSYFSTFRNDCNKWGDSREIWLTRISIYHLLMKSLGEKVDGFFLVINQTLLFKNETGIKKNSHILLWWDTTKTHFH